MIGHGINYIEKVLLIAQRLGKLSANITAYWTAVRLGPMSEMGPGCAKTLFLPPKTARNRGPSASTRRSEHIFALSIPESTRAQARVTLSELNGHTMRITARAVHARIATRSGLMPTMFITRVRL